MAISRVSNTPITTMLIKPANAAGGLNENAPFQAVNENGRYDTAELSAGANGTAANAKAYEIVHEPLAKADLSHLEGKWVVTLYADGRIDDPIAEYNRSQGNYFGDVWRAAMGMPSGNGIYQDAVASGMSREQAWEHQKQITVEHFNSSLDEALALANRFSPPSTNAYGKPVEYLNVYDENGRINSSAKISPKDYQENLQSIIDDMIAYLETSESAYPNLHKVHFG